jgi:hypothetical protein
LIRAGENKIKLNILDQKYKALKGTLEEVNKEVEMAKLFDMLKTSSREPTVERGERIKHTGV